MSPLERATSAVMTVMGDGPGSRDYLRATAIARAVIAAIRDPGDAAMLAGEAELAPALGDHYDAVINGYLSVGIWEAMIDAIAAEG